MLFRLAHLTLMLWLVALSLAAPASARAAAPNAVEREAPPLGAGTHTLSLPQAGRSRDVIVHVPATLDPRTPAPLLVALHGGGGHAAHMADDRHHGLIALAERAGVVVVFPNGHSRLPGGRFATWNAGACCGQARDQQIDDVAFIRGVVAAVSARVAVDAGRVYATGMSNGAMLAHRLACDAADLFVAVAAVAGTDATLGCTPSRPVSVLNIHARDDSHVLFDGGAGPDAFRDSTKVMAFVSVPETVARWVARNRCEAVPQALPARPGARCERHAGCADGSSVQLCVTDSGGHSWPGAPSVRHGKPAASTSLDANETLWAFFAPLHR